MKKHYVIVGAILIVLLVVFAIYRSGSIGASMKVMSDDGQAVLEIPGN